MLNDPLENNAKNEFSRTRSLRFSYMFIGGKRNSL